MEIALVGLRRSGKSLLHRLLSGKESPSPAKGAGVRIATVPIPDPALEALGKLFSPDRLTPATLSFVDWQCEQGVQEGVPAVENLLKTLRNADGFLLVLRGFASPEGEPDPWTDWKRLQDELILRDLEIVENRLGKLKRLVQVEKTEEHEREYSLLERCRETLQGEKMLSEVDVSSLEEKLLRGFQFLTMKPRVALVNLDDEALESRRYAVPRALAVRDDQVVRMAVKTEQEIASLPPGDKELFLPLLGEEGSRLPELLEKVRVSMGLIRFYTVKGPEVRAWLIRKGSTVVEAAGTIHTDMGRGFIRAEVIGWEELVETGGAAAAKEKGILRLEGKGYRVADGDVLEVRFRR